MSKSRLLYITVESNFEDFKAFFVLSTWDILDTASERDAIGGDFKWESHQVE